MARLRLPGLSQFPRSLRGSRKMIFFAKMVEIDMILMDLNKISSIFLKTFIFLQPTGATWTSNSHYHHDRGRWTDALSGAWQDCVGCLAHRWISIDQSAELVVAEIRC